MPPTRPKQPVLDRYNVCQVNLDHTDILGDTIEESASGPGIIKPGVPVIFDGSCPEAAAAVIRERWPRKDWELPCREISKNAFEILRSSLETILHFPGRNAYDRDVTLARPPLWDVTRPRMRRSRCRPRSVLAGSKDPHGPV